VELLPFLSFSIVSPRSLRNPPAAFSWHQELDEVTSALHDFSPFEEAASSDDEEISFIQVSAHPENPGTSQLFSPGDSGSAS
jgi:hypothetical protein